jgi:hypothetical protein
LEIRINEKNEVEAILKGERVHKSYTYRTCYLLAKYYKELGHSLLETRIAIFEWANKYKIYISSVELMEKLPTKKL